MSTDHVSVAATDDERALVAIDLGAESCRVSLLRRAAAKQQTEVVHRFRNAPVERNGSMLWGLQSICAGIEQGLRECASIASEGICSIGVDGWAVDYVRLDEQGMPCADPYCYRDPRTKSAFESLHQHIGVERLYALTGIQPLPINTLYQLYADAKAGIHADRPWINLPEYILYWLGGERVAEYTNATHTGMVDLSTRNWNREIFEAAGLNIHSAPKIVPSGSIVGKLRGSLAKLPAFRDTYLIAPACHDTASAIAGISAVATEWAYISSGTWSLVGAMIDKPCNTEGARRHGFTNLGGVGDKICFHKNVNGMWLLRQCIEHWALQGREWSAPDLIEKAEQTALQVGLLDLEDPVLLLPGDMPAHINEQRVRLGYQRIAESPENAPQFASLIFHSLARKYAHVLEDMKRITGRDTKCLYIVGGGSRNKLLNRLTGEATGLDIHCGEVESSTVGNLAIQQAALVSRGSSAGPNREN